MSTWKPLGVLAVAAAIATPAFAEVPAKPTFTKDIAPIFQEKCEACHRTASIAPMPLWHLDKSVGIQEFKNDRSPSDDQIETIVRWIDQGGPKGDPKDMPPPKTWPEDQGWNFAKLF